MSNNRSMREITWRLINAIFSIVLISGLAYYLYKNWDIFQASVNVSWYHIIAILICIFSTWMINCLQTVLLLRMEGVKIGFWENMLVQVATLAGNHLPMRIGTLIRFRYFKKIYGLNYARFGGIVGVRTLMLLVSTGLLGFIGTSALIISGLPVNISLAFLFAAVFIIPIAIYFIPLPKKRGDNGFVGKVWNNFISAFVTIKARPKLSFQLVGLLVLQFVFFAARLYISFDAIQIELSLWVFFLLAPTATLFSYISITPGNLAFREWIIGILSLSAGYDFNNGFFAGTIDRAVLLAVTLTFGTVCFFCVLARIQNNTVKKIPEAG